MDMDGETQRKELLTELVMLRRRVAELEDQAKGRQATEQEFLIYKHIFEKAGWGIAMGSAGEGTLDMMNPVFAEMHGYSEAELTGKPVATVYAPECRRNLPDYIKTAHEKGHHVFESRHVRKDGSVFPVLIDVASVKDETGQVIRRIVSVQDITERKQVEEEREQLIQELTEALNEIKALKMMIPICGWDKKFLMDAVREHYDHVSRRGKCPHCLRALKK
jgi:PAS domain S-box-containing protein